MCPYKASHYTGRFSHLEEKENKKKRNTNNTNNNSGVRDMKIILKLPAAAIEPVTPTHHHHHHHHHHHRHHRRPHHQLQQQQQHRQQSDDSRPASVRLRLLSLWLPEDRTESGSFFSNFCPFFSLFFFGVLPARVVCVLGSLVPSFNQSFGRLFLEISAQRHLSAKTPTTFTVDFWPSTKTCSSRGWLDLFVSNIFITRFTILRNWKNFLDR